MIPRRPVHGAGHAHQHDRDDLAAADWELSYRWTLPDGTDVTTGGNQLETALPARRRPRRDGRRQAQVKTPIQTRRRATSAATTSLQWDLRNRTTGQWLSTTGGIAPLDQNVAVEDPTSDQLGLEKFYQYAGKNTGAGSHADDQPVRRQHGLVVRRVHQPVARAWPRSCG